jgi:hypothetical protein
MLRELARDNELAQQRADGGWGQLLSMASDAYATRQALVLKPYIVETAEGPVEVADLFLEDKTAARGGRKRTENHVLNRS